MIDSRERSIEQLSKEADIAADFLEELLDIADYDGDIEMGVQNNRAVVQIVSDDNDDIKNLVGDNGEVVDALQQLTRLAVQQKTGERSHVIVDVAGYLKQKRLALKTLTLDAVETVRTTGEGIALPPMNSFERKIVHDIVREQGFESQSQGDEPHRFVTISAQTEVDSGHKTGATSPLPNQAVSDQASMKEPLAEQTVESHEQ